MFLAFGLAFLIEGLNRATVMFLKHRKEGDPVICVAFLIILAGIINKNRRTS